MTQNIISDKNQVVLKDWQHASKIFRANVFDLAPKSNHIFHVHFQLNAGIQLTNPSLKDKYKNDIGVLAKSVKLPGFKIKTVALNQYNRKTMVQSTHEYEPVDIIFHNDNIGLINELWRSYYTHYYADPDTAPATNGYNRNAYQKAPTHAFGHKGQTKAFFQDITIYHMSKTEYTSYKLINPMITAFDHQRLDYFSMMFHEYSMVLMYEAVEYGAGIVSSGDIKGFALDKYDHTVLTDKGFTNAALTKPAFGVIPDSQYKPNSTSQPQIQVSNQTYDNPTIPAPTESNTGVALPGPAPTIITQNNYATASTLT
jgi:hypothetical protein